MCEDWQYHFQSQARASHLSSMGRWLSGYTPQVLGIWFPQRGICSDRGGVEGHVGAPGGRPGSRSCRARPGQSWARCCRWPSCTPWHWCLAWRLPQPARPGPSPKLRHNTDLSVTWFTVADSQVLQAGAAPFVLSDFDIPPVCMLVGHQARPVQLLGSLCILCTGNPSSGDPINRL